MKKKVVFHLDPIEVVAEGKTDKELLKIGEQLVIESLKKQFPHYSYSITDADTLTQTTAKEGMIVEHDNEHGIITKINPKTIAVVLTGHRIVSGPAHLFKLSTKSFEEVRSKPRKIGDDYTYYEGDGGYLKVESGLIPAVIGKETKGKYRVYSIEKPGSYYTVNEAQLKKFFQLEK